MKIVRYVLLLALFFVEGVVSAQITITKGENGVEIVDENTLVKPGDMVPDFTVRMVDGSSVEMKSLRGKVVLVNFWATWCPPCRAEFVRIPAEIVERFKGEDFVLLAISREESLETVTKFREETGYTFPMGIDPERKIYDLFAKTSIPRNYLVGKEGRIVVSEMGYTPEKFDELIGLIVGELEK